MSAGRISAKIGTLCAWRYAEKVLRRSCMRFRIDFVSGAGFTAFFGTIFSIVSEENAKALLETIINMKEAINKAPNFIWLIIIPKRIKLLMSNSGAGANLDYFEHLAHP